MNGSVIPFPILGRRAGSSDSDGRQVGTTCKAELRRRYQSREQASRYLSSRGFLLLPQGWANGRWAATIEMENDECIVAVHLETAKAA
jgi:hypothetical protein